MRIVCPSCDAVYEVPGAMLAAGPRAVRCARCGQEWTPPAVEPPTVTPSVAVSPPSDPPPPPLEKEPPAMPAAAAAAPARTESRLSSYRVRTGPPAATDDAIDERLPPRDYETIRTGRGALVGWVFSVLLLVALAVAAVAWRGPIMAAWPPSERLYAVLGLR